MAIKIKGINYADRPIKAVLRDGKVIWQTREVSERKAWALWCASDSTLVFVYDDIAWVPGMEITDDSEGYENDLTVTAAMQVPDDAGAAAMIPWLAYKNDINTVVFQPSFYGFMPSSLSYWFYGCNALSSLRNRHRVTVEQCSSFNYTFAEAAHLEELDLSGWLFLNVTECYHMFDNCEYLRSITLGDTANWNTTNFESCYWMFARCSNLEEIKADLNFSTVDGLNSVDMFLDCFRLPGFDSDIVDARKAKNESESGYFVTYETAIGRVMLDGMHNRLVFTYDDLDYEIGHEYEIEGIYGTVIPEAIYELKRYSDDRHDCPWGEADGVYTISFAQSMENFYPLTTSYWFAGLVDLDALEQFELVNLDYVTKADSMFEYSNLNEISIERKDYWISRLTSASNMFANMDNLNSIYLSGCVLFAIDNADNMFDSCPNLSDIYVVAEKFDFRFTSSSDNMFRGDENLPDFEETKTDKEGARLVPDGYFQEA